MKKDFENELEVLMLNNPRGGRPQTIGTSIYLPLERNKNAIVDISKVEEETSVRFFLGYCHCGDKLVAGEKRALVMIDRICRRLGIDSMDDLQSRILKQVMSKYPQHPENCA